MSKLKDYKAFNVWALIVILLGVLAIVAFFLPNFMIRTTDTNGDEISASISGSNMYMGMFDLGIDGIDEAIENGEYQQIAYQNQDKSCLLVMYLNNEFTDYNVLAYIIASLLLGGMLFILVAIVLSVIKMVNGNISGRLIKYVSLAGALMLFGVLLVAMVRFKQVGGNGEMHFDFGYYISFISAIIMYILSIVFSSKEA